MLTKISAMFLMWVVIGFCMLIGTTIITMVKIYKLDPKNDRILNDFEDLIIPSALKDAVKEDAKRSGFARYFEMSIEWPMTLALIKSIYEKAYEIMKDEYDRGVRTRVS